MPWVIAPGRHIVREIEIDMNWDEVTPDDGVGLVSKQSSEVSGCVVAYCVTFVRQRSETAL
ncbi:hypothetical protein BKA82DRAFT_1000419, partial [Pisolithus tinctorius]